MNPKATRLHFNGKEMVLTGHDLPPPGAAEVRIRAEYSNISIGTELEYIRKARASGQPAPPLGYSLVGIVEAAGPGASVREGQRVLALAPHASAVVVSAAHGSLNVVPDTLDPAHATLGTLASVALHVVQRAAPALGESVVLFGCGLVGALVLQVLKHSGAERVAVVEPDEPRRQLAESLGADVTADPSRQDLQHALRTAAGTAGADLVIETAASGSVFPSAFEVLRIGGRLVCTSTFLDGLAVPLYPDIVEKELTVMGAHQPKCPPVPVPYYPYSQFENRARGLEWMARGVLKTDKLITHRVPAAEAPAFYARLAADRSVLGVVIDWTEPGGSL